ncbi:hypothetical protein Vadar_031719 [Vaccinium darrowii]|uniref:Uncharacterized protein n=1 Tax=Vaccinium darrowii TaxID=229202 RepID=A0ACB7YJH1_9ERIC|nr:hypothetical protein Vadar_031719 [Vaccinium darrowii]
MIYKMAKEIFNAKRDWILRLESCTDLFHWISEVDFDKIIILWHIATKLCYCPDKEEYPEKDINESANGSGNPPDSNNVDIEEQECKLSKVLSDYMLYLLIIQSTMLSIVVGIGRIRFRDTCAEAKKFFQGRKIGKLEKGKNCCLNISPGNAAPKGKRDWVNYKCKCILFVNTVVEHVTVKGDRSKSVLFDVSMLAQELKRLGRERVWKIISKVWVELMSYAAGRCRASTHAAQLSKGGELLSLVWLLMARLGLGDQFQISEGHARAKLIVKK